MTTPNKLREILLKTTLEIDNPYWISLETAELAIKELMRGVAPEASYAEWVNNGESAPYLLSPEQVAWNECRAETLKNIEGI